MLWFIMTKKRQRMCNFPRCIMLTTGTYCEEHSKKICKDYSANRTDKREQNLYNSRHWRKLSKLKLSHNPLCEMCYNSGVLEPAVLVHHIIEVKVDYSKRFDIDNLQSLCKSCHNKIHNQYCDTCGG